MMMSSPCYRWGCHWYERRLGEEYFDWPTLPELFPVSFPGVNTARDGFLVDIDL